MRSTSRIGAEFATLTRQSSFGALWGVTVGGTLLTLELLIVALLEGSSSALGVAPLAAWLFGAVGGGVAGAGLALVVGSIHRGRDLRNELAPAEVSGRLIASLLLIGGLGLIAAAQINFRLLPHLLSASSILANITIMILGLASVWLLIRWGGPGLSWFSAKVLGLWATAGLAVAVVVPWILEPAWVPAADPALWRPGQQPGGMQVEAGQSQGSRRLLVLGLDGIRWRSLDSLIERGELPNIASLMERGLGGPLLADLESGNSPTLWTTIMTGRPAEIHGVRSHAAERRVKAIWTILEDLGMKVVVVNVPGSFPADRLQGGMLAGFPLPQSLPPNLGWRVLGRGTSDPRGPVPILLPGQAAPGERQRVILRGMTAESPVKGTTPFLFWRRFRPWPAQEVAQRLWAWGAARMGEPYARFDLKVELGASDGRERIEGYAADREEPLFSLLSGEWSPWLEVAVRGTDYLFRVRALDAGQRDLFITSLFQESLPGLMSPGASDVLAGLERPYVAEGTGTTIFYEEDILEALMEHQLDLSATRTESGLRLMERIDWDAFIAVFTVTERIHHAFWKFHEPEPYRELARLSVHPLYRSHMPSPAGIARYGGIIDSVYRAVDRKIGELLTHTDDSTRIVLVSDHGHQAGHYPNRPTAGIHHPEGIYVMAGPTIVPPAINLREPPALEQTDIVPLILAHLGLPAADDMPERLPVALAPRSADGELLPLPPKIPSYEGDPFLCENPALAVDDEALREQLRSLGYLD